MIDGGLYNPVRTVHEFSFDELEAEVEQHGVAALNDMAAQVAEQPGITLYRVDDHLLGPRIVVIRERMIPTITTLGKEPTP